MGSKVQGLSCSTACGILVPWPGIESASCIGRRILNQWTTSETPWIFFFFLRQLVFLPFERHWCKITLKTGENSDLFHLLLQKAKDKGACNSWIWQDPRWWPLAMSFWENEEASMLHAAQSPWVWPLIRRGYVWSLLHRYQLWNHTQMM